MNIEEIKEDIANSLRNFGNIHNDKYFILENLRKYLVLNKDNLLSYISSLYEEYPNEEEYIRKLELKWFDKPFNIKEVFKYETNINKIKYKREDINDLVIKYYKELNKEKNRFTKPQIKKYLTDRLKNEINS